MKVGFIGCGGFASGNHIPNTVKNPNLQSSLNRVKTIAD